MPGVLQINSVIDGYYELFGAVIKHAIDDYRVLSKKTSLTEAERVELISSEFFLFNPAGLELFLGECMIDFLDVEAVRDLAKKIYPKKKAFSKRLAEQKGE